MACVGATSLRVILLPKVPDFSQQNKSMSEVIYPLFPKTQTPMPCTSPQTQFQPLSKSNIYSSVALLLPSLFLGAGTTLLTAGYSLLALSSFNLSHCTSQTNSSARVPHPREISYQVYQSSYYTSNARTTFLSRSFVPGPWSRISFSARDSFAVLCQ